MKERRIKRTTIRAREVYVIRMPRRVEQTLCGQCPQAVGLVTPDEAVRISGIGSRAVYRLIERGQIHFTETADGVGLICPATLLAQVQIELGTRLGACD
jgi:hypothetical protein